MHIILPLAPEAGWNYVKEFSKIVAEFMAKQIPERFVAKMGSKNRIGKIFIDYLRNIRGPSTVCDCSVRARPGLPVSVPIAREELEKLNHSDHGISEIFINGWISRERILWEATLAQPIKRTRKLRKQCGKN